MARVKSVWGIDIGQCALKAIKLRVDGDNPPQMEAFEVVEHSNVLSQSDVDSRVLIQASLEEFLQRTDVSDSEVSVSVLGQSSFTRFVKLPPVEQKKIPDIVRFEAEQQIPFPIEEVTWRYQCFQDPDSPEVEAGIFAMKQIDVAEMLSYFVQEEMEVDLVQMAPLALYNFMMADGQIATDGATMLADVGADKTHLIVSDGHGIWTRTIQIGGNNFTEALVKSFKLSFPKAEKLKRTAASSKYARQIFQVMRPVFADLVQEIQRSIGYYTSLHRESRFKQLVGMGNGFRLPGMQKYLEQNLNMPVTQVRKFNQLEAPQTETPGEKFSEHVLSFGVAYGLAVQALGQGLITTNLLPGAIIKKRLWAKKKPWFAVAAAALVLACGLFVFRGMADIKQLQAPQLRRSLAEAQKISKRLQRWKNEANKIDTNLESKEKLIREHLSLRAYASTWPEINSRINEALLLATTTENDRQILKVFATATPEKQQAWGRSPSVSDQARLMMINRLPYRPAEKRKPQPLRMAMIEMLARTLRQNRNLFLLEGMTSVYMKDLSKTDEKTETEKDKKTYEYKKSWQKESAGPRGFQIEIFVRTPLSRSKANVMEGRFINSLTEVFAKAPNFELVGEIDVASEADGAQSLGVRKYPAMERFGVSRPGETKPEGPVNPDPLFPTESLDSSVRKKMTFRVAVTGDGIAKPSESSKTKKN
ncbi:MAG: type IV pilus assembly protein PilM [Phycisphaerae bacterium]|nr:type IV pilus assembly protein PilM [Phycisphaerae bacterium]